MWGRVSGRDVREREHVVRIAQAQRPDALRARARLGDALGHLIRAGARIAHHLGKVAPQSRLCPPETLQVFRPEACVLGDACQDPRTNLLAVVEGEHEITPALAHESAGEPVWRLVSQPSFSNAASIRLALAEGH